MIKHTIKYTDFDGKECEEVAYFNMNRTELVSFVLGLPDDLTDELKNPNEANVEKIGALMLEKLGRSGIFDFVKDLVSKAYGVKSADGRRFIKSEQLSTEFTQTLAYDEFIMDLFSDDEKVNNFIQSLIPVNSLAK